MGSDKLQHSICLGCSYFNPRSPCGERPILYYLFFTLAHISIHAPRVGSDVMRSVVTMLLTDFNPRSPCGERRFYKGLGIIECYFNPRSPCGERRQPSQAALHRLPFQSTLPVWGATRGAECPESQTPISIHAPRVGSDGCSNSSTSFWYCYFNPRSPCGERLSRHIRFCPSIPISIHAPRVGSDFFRPRRPARRH